MEFRPYRILGACYPALAHEALKLEDKVGTMPPCNVMVQELARGGSKSAAMDPVASMTAIDDPALIEKARVVRGKSGKGDPIAMSSLGATCVAVRCCALAARLTCLAVRPLRAADLTLRNLVIALRDADPSKAIGGPFSQGSQFPRSQRPRLQAEQPRERGPSGQI